ncbi:hypothetical protein N7519_009868 [Penicillium mononematosum]|uniref:uncharacterized protein n=1 Tax=Penicillium mononematosum TaxID=268346 RepID=UPI00254865BA|nr:uncharacterized protein N7519_009868 [Penicillium mononematosum]KAJ6179407.1 hypothetical protein N7519_009868 [Penicillium mononematosum]
MRNVQRRPCNSPSCSQSDPELERISTPGPINPTTGPNHSIIGTTTALQPQKPPTKPGEEYQFHQNGNPSQSAAQEFLAAYLDRAATDPSLQPNASISEHGPVSRTTAAAPNLILHNLKRVQAGLAGELLGRDLTVAKQNPGEEYLDVAAGIPQTNNQDQLDDSNDLVMNDAEFGAEAEAFADQEAGIDKEERKRKKKERRLAEKKSKAQAKAEESD